MRDYRSSTPWAATQGQDPPAPGLARTEPARAAGLVPDLVVPLGQSLVTGALDAAPTDAERLKAGLAVTCALCGRQVTNDDRGASPGDDGQVICGACNGGIR